MAYQRKNGSLFNSPSTTAAAAIYSFNDSALNYLDSFTNKFGGPVPAMYPQNIYSQLCTVDALERTGISRIFVCEIRDILDRTYRCWLHNEEDVMLDIPTCAMAFRLLRTHGYDITSDEMAHFCKQSSFDDSIHGYLDDTKTLLELYRTSQLRFSREDLILENIGNWSAKQLKQQLSSNKLSTSARSEISRHFLNGLDMSIWEMKVTSIQESVNMSTLTLDSLYTKLKTHEMNILSRKVDSKSSALVSSSSSLVVDASSSMPSFLAAFNATSDDQLEQIEEEDLALAANRIARAMNNARNRKRGGPNHCFECGSIDHLRSYCPKLGRGKREDKDGGKTNNNKPNNYKSKGSNQGRKMENLRKAFQQVCAAFEPLSDVDGESGDDDKGNNVSDVCFMAHGESDTEYEDNEVSAFEGAINILSAKNKKCEKMYKKHEFIIESLKSEIDRLKYLIPNDDDCENCEVLMNEISKIRDVNASHDLKNRSSLACSFALHTRTLDELFLTKKLLQKYQIAFHASLKNIFVLFVAKMDILLIFVSD
uniref:Terpene synthase, N-terminal domain containing protein n=1 Tax=Oryza sativa subsp. japonica TaxID=39947 RepID=Q2QQJ8_ORYSJ|nr:Terpene synthase, N-terminal domain containing protein [Oryza sativa Japonica Group]